MGSCTPLVLYKKALCKTKSVTDIYQLIYQQIADSILIRHKPFHFWLTKCPEVKIIISAIMLKWPQTFMRLTRTFLIDIKHKIILIQKLCFQYNSEDVAY